MKNLVFDVNVILDLWLQRRPEEELLLLSDLLATGSQSGYQCWICACSIPVLEYVVRRELKKNGADALQAKRIAKQLLTRLLEYAAPLTCFGFHQDASLVAKEDVEDAQIVRAASLLCCPTAIVTNEKRFDVADANVLERTPAQAREWIQDLTQTNIEFVDLKTQQDRIRPDLEKSIHTVLHHGRYILGPEVRELEARLGQAAEAKHAIACSSGTDALLMALMALEVGPGDAVLTTPFSFVATADVIARLGATPVFVDIDPQTYNIDPVKLCEMLECWNAGIKHDAGMPDKSLGRLRPKAIITVDLYGLPCDYDAINAVARKHGLAVIRDGAQSFGSRYKGRSFGTLADISCTSFFPTKPLGCYGDGGALFTDNDDLAHRLTSIRVHGQGANKYDTVRLGIKGRMDTLQAAILLPKLDIFPKELEARAELAWQYAAHLESNEDVQLPVEPEGVSSAWALYIVQLPNTQYREAVQARLKENGIPSMVYYGKPLHLQPAFASLGYKPGAFPVAEQCANRVLSLPLHPYLRKEEVEYVNSNLKSGKR
ncbi:DegT/DnrJ/EryC1/StrS family aminotransferase [Desulfonatronum thiodismutans]|uniref:DegT/DnrJ/EryC1/StrS family aminotransferase n=1 Tax=Desulfonatronum thiodismutans TaxID=159290 RepID=UPI000B180B74|nr:DegT/DnrJ/EryC1/StrS family aminotransferase [Desulfonatronum thiodismutans]